MKSLASVETLGSTSAINSDKTGTLTLNQVTVVEVIDPTDRYAISGMGYGLDGDVKHAAGNTNTIEQAILPFLIANDAKLVDGKVVGDPTEGALLVLGHKAKLDVEGTQAAYPRLATLPFDPTYKLMAVFADAKDESGKAVVRAFVKGAGPAVIGRAASALANGESVPWGDEQNTRSSAGDGAPRRQGSAHHGRGHPGHRPGGLRPRRRPAVAGHGPSDDGDGRDDRSAPSRVQGRGPQRPERQHPRADGDRRRRRHRRGDREAARHPRRGDPRRGLRRPAPRRSGCPASTTIGVVGRVAPEHKVLMVETLRKKGDVVAMTGDGVNDAPAIKAADIGIAMGTGTEVAKNAAKMILTDDNFATIVRAVSEGRKLYDNMLKYIRFMMVALVTYIVTFLLASLLDIAGGQPFSAVQILWINFLITAPVGIALGLDKETPGLMKRKPRPRAASIMSRPVIVTVGLAGLFMSVAIDLLIVFGRDYYDNVAIGSTMGLVAFSLMLVVAALECRDQTATILRMETLNNNIVNLTILVEIALALLIARGGALTSLLGTQALTGRQWLIGALPALVLFILWEIGKLIARRGAESAQVGDTRRGDACRGSRRVTPGHGRTRPVGGGCRGGRRWSSQRRGGVRPGRSGRLRSRGASPRRRGSRRRPRRRASAPAGRCGSRPSRRSPRRPRRTTSAAAGLAR